MSVIDEIRTGMRLREAGKPAEARELLTALWPEVNAATDAFARCFLDLAENYLRVGDEDRAREHYRAGLEMVPCLGDDSYGDSIREAFSGYAAEHPGHDVAP